MARRKLTVVCLHCEDEVEVTAPDPSRFSQLVKCPSCKWKFEIERTVENTDEPVQPLPGRINV